MEVKVSDVLPDDSKMIREKVFVEEQGFKEEFDETDKKSLHIVMYDGDKAAATCRIYRDITDGTFVLGRVAVLRDLRGNGIGSLLIGEAEKIAWEHGGDTLILHSQCTAAGFYRRLGYTEYGEIELDEGCPHIWMKKGINNG